MRSVRADDTAVTLASLVDAAERGETTTILRDGRPTAVLVPIAEALTQRTVDPAVADEPTERPQEDNFIAFLMTFPGGIEFERDQSPVRDVDF
jgi:antitoxin (DNA-binding transcriptional repressor) of toxin-antitoxin stability system